MTKKDADYWARLHVRADKAEPINLPPRRRVTVFSPRVGWWRGRQQREPEE